MEHMTIEIAFLTMIVVYFIASIAQKYVKIPLPHSIIILSVLIYKFQPELLNIHINKHFDTIILFLIPIILMYDAMHLKWKDIKQFKWSIGYLAIFSVTISILLGVSLYYLDIFGRGLSIGAYVALFSMNMATDAISVGNIFSQFKGIPHNIKVLVEGESLGNDATAMIAFYFIGLPWIINGTFDLTNIPLISLKLFSISTVIGLVIGFVGFYLLSLFNLFKQELLIILGVTYGTFTLAEIMNVSGILALIVGVITITTLIENSLRVETLETKKNKNIYKFLRKQVTTKVNQENIYNTIDTFSFFAVILVFISMASMININNLIYYWKEILIMFVATTLIRAIVMTKFLLVGKATKSINYVGLNGWIILNLAGIKGALSIVMLHSLPKTFHFYKMFESITIGVILLSIFIYGFILLFYMLMKEKKMFGFKIDNCSSEKNIK